VFITLFGSSQTSAGISRYRQMHLRARCRIASFRLLRRANHRPDSAFRATAPFYRRRLQQFCEPAAAAAATVIHLLLTLLQPIIALFGSQG
jgi:hypothetical protein